MSTATTNLKVSFNLGLFPLGIAVEGTRLASSRASVTALVTIQVMALKGGWVGDFESAPLASWQALAPKWLRIMNIFTCM